MLLKILKRALLCAVAGTLVINSTLGFTVSSKEVDAVSGSYKNEKYKLTGLYNDNGDLVQGVNYTPTSYYGWWPTVSRQENFSETYVRKDLAAIQKLGYNSIRILQPLSVQDMESSYYDELLEKTIGTYKKLFNLCREYGLTACVIMAPKDGYKTNYKAENSGVYRLLKAYIDNFDKEYDDVIVLWEIANEPDPNTWGYTLEESIEIFETDEEWAQVAPYLAWMKDVVKELGAKNPVSIGAMNSPRCTSWDALNMDVCNIHNYRTTISDVDQFNSEMWEMDMQTLGYCRPTVLSEIGMPNGMLQPNSDIIQYCIENDIAYYVWGYANISNEGYMQGLVNNVGELRTGTLSYSSIQGYSNWQSLAVTAYNNVVGGNDSSKNAFWFLNLGLEDETNLDKMAYGTETYYNWVRGMLPYWTPDFREALYMAEGDTYLERFKFIVAQASYAVMPYIRTDGSYENDNLLGGDAKANYYENITKYMSLDGATSQGRARFAFGKGQNGSDAILVQQRNQVMLLNEIDYSVPYSFSVALKVADDSYAGVGIACQDDKNSDSNCAGVYLRVTQARSKDFEENNHSFQKPYTVSVYLNQVSGVSGIIQNFKYDPDLIDEDGYVNLKVVFGGKGNASSPLTARVYISDTKLGEFKVVVGLNDECKYLSLISPFDNAANYYDNLVLKNEETGKIVLSDTFDTGRNDYDYLTYSPKDATNSNTKILDKIALILSNLDKDSVLVGTPKDVNVAICDSLMIVKWKYGGRGESGFEIQRSIDGENWERIWRTLPETDYAIIPVYESQAGEYQYRVSPISSSNTAVKPSEAVKAIKGKGQSGDILASCEFKGKEYRATVIGSGVFLEGYGSECPDTTDQEFFVKKLFKKTTSKDVRITNLPLEQKEQKAQTVKAKQTIPMILFTIAALFVLTSVGLFGGFLYNRKKK